MESTTLSGSSKRPKAPGNMAQVAQCLVDGCEADLSQCREYHRRHKVCELHSKTPKVTIGGREQRFCQQCSRFHSLVEFDEEKRSCRKRLDGHNRRRRKPQPDSLPRSSGLLFGNQQGSRLLSFGSPETFPSSSWPGSVANADNDLLSYNNQTEMNYIGRQNSFTEASTHGYKGGHQFQFTLSTECTPPEACVRQPLLDPNPAAPANSSCSQKIFSDGFNQVVDSDRALSLLSSTPIATREIGLNHMVQPNTMHRTPQSLPRDLHSRGVAPYLPAQDTEREPVVSITDSQVTINSDLHFQDTFHSGPDGSSTSQQTLTFMWE